MRRPFLQLDTNLDEQTKEKENEKAEAAMGKTSEPLIISASRRTDIPNYYAPWFIQRLKEGFVLVRNIRNFHQVRRIDLSVEKVACIVFWTKNPAPLMEHLEALACYPYYVHYTITAYETDIEPRVPPIGESVDRFRALADRLGPDRVIWRYDPVFISKTYSMEYHQECFGAIAEKLQGYTRRCVFSFLDIYRNTASHADKIAYLPIDDGMIRTLANDFAKKASQCGIKLTTCAEGYDFTDLGIPSGSCIDPFLIERLSGYSVSLARDRGQRPFCRCAPSVDIGMYNTCLNLCAYCYANYSEQRVHANYAQARIHSPFLIGTLEKDDVVENLDTIGKAQLALFGKTENGAL